MGAYDSGYGVSGLIQLFGFENIFGLLLDDNIVRLLDFQSQIWVLTENQLKG